MTESKHPVRPCPIDASIVAISFVAGPVFAAAPTITDAPRPVLVDVFGRMDLPAIGVVVVAILVLVVLVWRIAVTVKREGPGRKGKKGKKGKKADRGRGAIATRTGPSTRASGDPGMNLPTDWGLDQNKRSAMSRSPPPVEVAYDEVDTMPRLPEPTTIASVPGEATASVVPDDALGKSPVAQSSPYRSGTNPYYLRVVPEERIEVEEVADVLTQADLLVQLGDPKEAMNLLSRHIRETENPGPQVWLALLNLYQSTGREAQYVTLAEGFRMLFNSEVPPWAASPEVAARDLESYAPVLERIQQAWPGPQARPYLESLLADDRGGSRAGFSLTAYREILFLVGVLDEIVHGAREEGERLDIQRKLATEI